jgi:signal transduction histidine kinase
VTIVERATDPAGSRRRQLSHDIQHELATIGLLATMLGGAPELGPDSRARARLILGELRWLEELQRAYDEADAPPGEPAGTTRLDRIASEVVAAVRLSGDTRIEYHPEPVRAYGDRLAFWRALRNVLQNAVRAAGPAGRVTVRITAEGGWASVQIDDDGPGFGALPADPGALGLGIVRDAAVACDGTLELRRSRLGGGCVRLRVPAARPLEVARAEEMVA